MYLVLLIKRSKRDVEILNWNGNIISCENLSTYASFEQNFLIGN